MNNARKVKPEDYFKLIAESFEFDPMSVYSSGVAARGHILEPYAVAAIKLRKIYHWDDVVIENGGRVAFSPDALDIPQPTSDKVIYNLADLEPINEVYEIKSYGAAKTESVLGNIEQCEEKIQVATQMYVCEKAERGNLVLYNPRMERGSLHVYGWKRTDLTWYFDTIQEIEAKYIVYLEEYGERVSAPLEGPSEEQIITELCALNALDIN